MAISTSVKDNEQAKFRDAGSAGTKVAVTTEGDVNGLLAGVQYDDIQATFPTATTEIYTYLKDSSIVAQILITYSSASKQVFTRAQRL